MIPDSVDTEERHHVRIVRMDMKQFGCVGGPVPGLETPIIKYPVDIHRLSLDLSRKLVKDDAAEAVVDTKHEKHGVTPAVQASCCHCIVHNRGAQPEHLGDDRKALGCICLEKRLVGESLFNEGKFPAKVELCLLGASYALHLRDLLRLALLN